MAHPPSPHFWEFTVLFLPFFLTVSTVKYVVSFYLPHDLRWYAFIFTFYLNIVTVALKFLFSRVNEPPVSWSPPASVAPSAVFAQLGLSRDICLHYPPLPPLPTRAPHHLSSTIVEKKERKLMSLSPQQKTNNNVGVGHHSVQSSKGSQVNDQKSSSI